MIEVIVIKVDVQIESARPDALAMTLLGDALRAVACARGINAERLHLPQQLKALLNRILVNTGM